MPTYVIEALSTDYKFADEIFYGSLDGCAYSSHVSYTFGLLDDIRLQGFASAGFSLRAVHKRCMRGMHLELGIAHVDKLGQAKGQPAGPGAQIGSLILSRPGSCKVWCSRRVL